MNVCVCHLLPILQHSVAAKNTSPCITVWKRAPLRLEDGQHATSLCAHVPGGGGGYALARGFPRLNTQAANMPAELASSDGRAAGKMRAGEVNHVVRRGLTRSSGSAAATAYRPMNNTAGDIACLAVRPATPPSQAAQSSYHPGVTGDQAQLRLLKTQSLA